MRAAAVVVVVVVVACTACVNRRVYDPPARLTVGASTRHYAPAPAKDTSGSTFRTATPPATEVTIPQQEAKMAAIAFTMASRYGTYAGGEVETGVLDEPGSSAAAVYGIIGARQALARVNFAVELAAGQRWLRYGIDDQDVSKLVAEPRLRADFWLSERFSLGATAGLTLGDQTVWMAGAFLGIHSHDFGR